MEIEEESDRLKKKNQQARDEAFQQKQNLEGMRFRIDELEKTN